MAINLAKVTKEELTQLLQIARQEAAEVEVVSKPLEKMQREFRVLRKNEPIAQLSGGAKFGHWAWLFVVFGIVAILTPLFLTDVFGIDVDLENPIVWALTSLIALVLPPIFVYLINKKKRQKYADWQKKTTPLQERIEAEQLVLNQIVLRVANKLLNIPDEYCSTLALDIMLGYIRSFRAEDWRECTALYEEQKHRGILEEDSKKNLQLQHEIAQATKSAADSAATSAFYAEQAALNTKK